MLVGLALKLTYHSSLVLTPNSEMVLLRCAPYWNIANHGFAVGKFCQFSILGVHEAKPRYVNW